MAVLELEQARRLRCNNTSTLTCSSRANRAEEKEHGEKGMETDMEGSW